MDILKKDIKFYSIGLIVLAVLDAAAVIFCLAIRGFDLELLTRVIGKGTTVSFALVSVTIAFNMLCALLKVKLSLKGLAQLKTYTYRKHLTHSILLLVLLVISFALAMVIFATGYYGMITAFLSAFSIYWTIKFRSKSKSYLQIKDAENKIDAPVEEVDAEELDEAVDFDVEVVEE